LTITAANETQEQVNQALIEHGYDPAPDPVPSAAPADAAAPAPPSSEEGITAPASEPEEITEQAQPGETPQAKAAKTRKAVQERIDELTRQRYTEAGRREQAEAEVARLRQQLADIAAGRTPAPEVPVQPAAEQPGILAAPVKPVHPGKMPRQADFDDYEQFGQALDTWEAATQQYQDDLAEYSRKQAIYDFAVQRAEEDAQAEIAQIEAAWNEKLVAAKANTPDWDDTLAAIDTSKPSGQLTNAMAEAIRESEAGPEVLYWLAKHPEEAERAYHETFVNLGSVNSAGVFVPNPEAGRYIPTANRNAARAVARIEAQLSHPAPPAAAAPANPPRAAAPPAPRPAATSAPNPIRPLRGGANTPAPDATKVIGLNGYTARDFERDFPIRRRQ
jgi:hypothetical protein